MDWRAVEVEGTFPSLSSGVQSALRIGESDGVGWGRVEGGAGSL